MSQSMLAELLAEVELQVMFAEDPGPAPAPGGDAPRRALRRVASGVTVLTVEVDGLRHGTTVSAIVPISRDPLMLGVCLRVSSSFTTMVERRRFFSVNVLGTGQARIAGRFATPGRRPGDAQFAGLRWTSDRLTGAPLIGGSLAYMACRVAGCQRVGDHDLIIADVIGGAAEPGLPLLSFAGRLHNEETQRSETQ
jgi:flavin reductase (DIM6/NTAB) family NADH-FMN oxidoreductase RutF